MSVDLNEAYRHCEDVVRVQAANFSHGIRLLPPPKRRALSAVYAFARRVDDVGDGDLAADEKLTLLDAARRRLDDFGASVSDPVIAALADACSRYEVPLDALRDLIDGVEMDVRGTEYRTFDELAVYCRRVASSIGRACLAVFGPSDVQRAQSHGDALGIAMQLTNILRDVVEDLDRGRIYLPAGDRERFECVDLRSPPKHGFAELMRFEAARAREWFGEGLALLPLLDRRSAACVAAMAGIYVRILRRIDRDPGVVLERRISLPTWEKAFVAARALAGRAA
jgi:phytoene synthase